MLAHKYTDNIDPTGYYVSEKIDGARAVYFNKQFTSRTNKPFNAPTWFLEEIEKCSNGNVLDGELFTKRQDFSGAMSAIRKKIPVDKEWEGVTYIVFDIPTIREPYNIRREILENIFSKCTSKYIKLVDSTLVKSKIHLDKIHKDLTSDGAEGTMLNSPNSYYESKRSKGLLKNKDFSDDEGIVQGFEFGEGRNSNVMGNLIVKWLKKSMSQKSFDVGSGFNDDQRKNHAKLFPKGTIVKIKYFEITKTGSPRFPIYIGVRDKKDL
jgi:DNA ligase-1